MANSKPTPIHSIQHTKFSRQDGWQLHDISLCSSGNIAVSGGHYWTDRTFVYIYSTVDNSDSRDKPTLLYEKEFEKYEKEFPLFLPYRSYRSISFIKPNSTEIVTCLEDNVTVLDYNRDVVLRSRKVNGSTRCLSVSESQIFIGLVRSDIVNIYDNDLNRIKSIKLKEIRGDYPWNISAVADRLYVCTLYGRAIVYSQTSGSILSEYTTVQDYSKTYSITVNVQLCVVAVLWNQRQVAVYSFTNNCLVVFDVKSVTKIRISDQGRIVTGNEYTGEVKIYDLAQFFTYNNLKSTLSSLFSKHDLEELVKYFKISDDSLENDSDDSLDDDSDGRRDDKEQAARLLSLLEEKQFFQDGDFHHLKEAFSELGKCHTSMVMSHVDFYQQYVADKNTTNYMQTSEDNERGCNLQVDVFSGDWSACDMSLGSSYMVVAGYCNTAKKTSLDFICKDDSGSWSSWVKTREFDRGGSDSERVVSFIDEHRIVTCCGNVVEIIHCDTNETEVKQTLQSSCFATCITVRNQDVYIGFKEPANILVLNRDLLEKRTITLKEIKTMWPIDLAAIPGKLLVCLKNTVSSKVILFKKKNGQKLVEYRNVEDENRTPQSVAVNEESDMVGILWAIDPEEYDREPYGQISLHSLTHGYCLSVVSVAFTVHGYDCSCDDGCSSGKRIQLLSGQLAVMDDLGGVKLYNMKEVLSEENVSYALSQTLSCRDPKGFQAALENDEDISDSDGGKSGSELDNESNKDGKNPQKISKLYKILAILTEKRHVDSECITNLREKFSQFEGSSHDDCVSKLHVDRNEVQLYRFHWYNDDDDEDDDDEDDDYCKNDVDICFGSNNEVAVSHFSKKTHKRYVYINNLDRDKKIQPSVCFYRNFDDGNSKLYVSFLDGCRAVTCCDDLIEVTDFDAYGKITNSHRLSSPATCMATKDGDVFIRVKSSEIVVFDSDLEKKRTVTVRVKNGEWPHDLTVISGKVFVCTKGTSQRALSFNVEHGQQVTEYSYKGSEMYEDFYPVSIAVCESLDLIGISWYGERGNCWDYEKFTTITLHSLSRGFCLSILDDNPARIIRFSPDNYIYTVSRHGEIERCLVGQMVTFESWKAGFAHLSSPYAYDLLRGFYQLSVEETDNHTVELDQIFSDKKLVERIKSILAVLIEKGYITSTNVTSLKTACAGLGKLYAEKFYQPVEAYIKYASKTCVAAVPVHSTASDNIAELLLQLQYSTQSQNNTTSISTVFQQRSLIQRDPGQHSLQTPAISSLPGPSNAPIRASLSNSAAKRICLEGDHSAGDNGCHGKRAKISEDDSQGILQTSQTPSFVQLSQGHPVLQPTSVPTPTKSFTPVTGSSVLHEMLPVVTAQSIRTELPHHFNDTALVFSGQQRELHPSQHEPLLAPLAIHQPVGSEVIQQSGSFTELNPPNQVWQNGESQVRQQGSYSGGPSRSQQSVIASISQTPQQRGQIGLSYTPQTLPHLRQFMPSNVRQPLQPQVRHSMPPPFSHSMGPNVRQQLQPQGSPFRPLNLRQTVLPQVRQSSQPQIVQTVGQLIRSQFGQIGLSCTPQTLPNLRHSMPSNVQQSLQPQVRPSMPPQLSHSMGPNVRQQLQPQGSPFRPLNLRQTVQPQVRHSSQPHTLQAVEQLTRSQLASQVTQNDQRDSLQGLQSVDYSTSQQARHSLRQQQMRTTQSLGPPITENSEQIVYQNENTTMPQQTGYIIGQQTLQLRQADLTIGRERTEHEVHMEGYSRLNTQQNIQQTAQCTQPPGSNTQQNIQQTTECIRSNNVLQQDRPDTECTQANIVLQQDRPDTEFDMGEQELVVTESRTTHETSVPSTIGHESVPTGSHVESDQLIPVAESHFQKLKYIHEELGHLLSSSKSPHPLQDVQGTSSVSGSEKVARKIGSEYEQEAVRYLESLPEADKSALLAFKDMGDDREELVRRLVENVFTGEERKNGNCWGAGKYQKLDGDKLKRLRQVTFYLCPIRTRKQFSDKLEDKEWKRLCGVIDVANRHYRQELNRQKKGKGR